MSDTAGAGATLGRPAPGPGGRWRLFSQIRWNWTDFYSPPFLCSTLLFMTCTNREDFWLWFNGSPSPCSDVPKRKTTKSNIGVVHKWRNIFIDLHRGLQKIYLMVLILLARKEMIENNFNDKKEMKANIWAEAFQDAVPLSKLKLTFKILVEIFSCKSIILLQCLGYLIIWSKPFMKLFLKLEKYHQGDIW